MIKKATRTHEIMTFYHTQRVEFYINATLLRRGAWRQRQHGLLISRLYAPQQVVA
jgi:HEPN domain-containing protein